jgi:hypothetical protein
MEKYFTNDDSKFDLKDHIDKYALIYLGVVFVSCVLLRLFGII